MTQDCLLCLQEEGDAEFDRTEVWADALWRLTTSLDAEVLGFSYLEPKRHIPHIEDLDGPEAATFGTVLARATSALKEATDARRVFMYAFGGQLHHLHLFLVPVRPGDPVVAQIIEGEVESERRPGVRFVGAALLPRNCLANSSNRSRLQYTTGCLAPSFAAEPPTEPLIFGRRPTFRTSRSAGGAENDRASDFPAPLTRSRAVLDMALSPSRTVCLPATRDLLSEELTKLGCLTLQLRLGHRLRREDRFPGDRSPGSGVIVIPRQNVSV